MTNLTKDQEKDEKLVVEKISQTEETKELIKSLEDYFNKRYSEELNSISIEYDEDNKEFVIRAEKDNLRGKTEYPESIPLLIKQFRQKV